MWQTTQNLCKIGWMMLFHSNTPTGVHNNLSCPKLVQAPLNICRWTSFYLGCCRRRNTLRFLPGLEQFLSRILPAAFRTEVSPELWWCQQGAKMAKNLSVLCRHIPYTCGSPTTAFASLWLIDGYRNQYDFSEAVPSVNLNKPPQYNFCQVELALIAQVSHGDTFFSESWLVLITWIQLVIMAGKPIKYAGSLIQGICLIHHVVSK